MNKSYAREIQRHFRKEKKDISQQRRREDQAD